MKFLLHWLLVLDRFVNDKIFRGRYEYISGRCHRRIASGCRLCKWLCNALNKIDPDHCHKAFLADRLKNPDLPWI